MDLYHQYHQFMPILFSLTLSDAINPVFNQIMQNSDDIGNGICSRQWLSRCFQIQILSLEWGGFQKIYLQMV